MARRKLGDGSERYSEFVGLWLTQSQRNKLDDWVADEGRAVSAIARDRIFPRKAPNPGDEPEVRRNPQAAALLRHLDGLSEHGARVGNNLNQVAYHLNAGRDVERELHRIEEALFEIRELNTLIRLALERVISL
jgi:hypothetical protein